MSTEDLWEPCQTNPPQGVIQDLDPGVELEDAEEREEEEEEEVAVEEHGRDDGRPAGW